MYKEFDTSDGILDIITMLMQEEEISFKEAVDRFKELHQDDYDEKALQDAIAEFKKEVAQAQNKKNTKREKSQVKPPAAKASFLEGLLVDDQEAKKNYEMNTQKIDPSTDEKEDPVAKMGPSYKDKGNRNYGNEELDQE